MSSINTLRGTLRAHDAQPKKSLGQNFLVDGRIAERIVSAAGVSRGTHIPSPPSDSTQLDVSRATLAVEIGPGTGVLTRLLSERAEHVYAIELDERMIAILKDSLGESKNLTIVHDDALKVDFDALLANEAAPYVVLGNLPYYITSHAIRKILESQRKPQRIVLMVQLEVARRMTAKPDDMNLLAVGTQFYGATEMLFNVPPSAFYPQPNVDSAVVRITPHAEMPSVNADKLFALARAGFGQPRKQLRNTLSTGLNLTREQSAELLLRAKIDPTRRPETLSIPEWVQLTNTYERIITP